ncbi:hypothetical protein [Gemmata obscuriglobus]|nr:hypothetical protein [Gemmata obscuriglobus]
MTVWLTGFDIPPALLALVPESVARECNLLPFAERGLALFVAAVDPNNMHVETVQKVAFILQRHIVLVGANPAQLHTIINSKYGNFDYDYGATFLEFDYRPLLPNDPPALAASEDSATCATWCVNRILREAAYLCADRIHLTREGQQGVIWFRLDGGWVEGGVIPSRYRGSAFTRLAQAAHISTDWVFGDTIAQIPMIGEFPIRVDNRPLRVRVTMRPTPNGPDVVLDLNREPV